MTEAHHQEADSGTSVKDSVYVAVYNDGDISEYLYTKPAFATGFLALEPQDDKQAHPIHLQSTVEPSGTDTTPPTAVEGETTAKTPVKPAMKNASTQVNNSTKVSERRPSFIEVTAPSMHAHDHEHKTHRRHSSESHLPMSWWPDTETTAQHEWVEGDDASADGKVEIIQEEVWEATFYD